MKRDQARVITILFRTFANNAEEKALFRNCKENRSLDWQMAIVATTRRKLVKENLKTATKKC